MDSLVLKKVWFKWSNYTLIESSAAVGRATAACHFLRTFLLLPAVVKR